MSSLMSRILSTPQVGATAGPVIAMELAAGVDADPYCDFGANGFDVVVVEFRAQHEVAGPGADGFGLALDVPVDLAAHDHPPLVVLVVVGIVGRTGRMDDHESLDVVAQNERLSPGLVERATGEDLVQSGMQLPDVEDRNLNGHGDLPIGRIVLADNLAVLATLADASVDLIYVDPPFNTGRRQTMHRLSTVLDDRGGDRTGFQGRRYRTVHLGSSSFLDVHDNYLAFLEPRLREFHRVLKSSGSLYVHVDYREVHYVKILLDEIFGRACFLNEIIWAYDYGGRPRRRWPAKHDNILVYVKHPRRYYFDPDAAERIPYMAPSLVGPAKAARGKRLTDTWWSTIVPTGGKERTGYPTQKPLAIARRIVTTSSPPGGLVADFFAGSGTTGVAAFEGGRAFLLVDKNEEALRVMRQRFLGCAGVEFAR
jgi:site-specific DNA-methyltransferase (adenine-specific)